MNILVYFYDGNDSDCDDSDDLEVAFELGEDSSKLSWLKMISPMWINQGPNGEKTWEHEDYPDIEFSYWFRIDDPIQFQKIQKWAEL
jgi:hypothetical protein